MFWERFYSLCQEAGVKPNSIREAIGIVSLGTMTKWKNRGVIPAKTTLMAIAAHFNTTVEYLLGESPDRHPPAPLGNEKAPAPSGAGVGWSPERAALELTIDGLSADELRRVEEFAAFVKSQRSAAPQ